MKPFRAPLAALLALVLATGAAGCAADASEGDPAQLIVTRDFGTSIMLGMPEVPTPVTPGLTAMRQLQSKARGVKTTFGGKFVSEIDELKGQDGLDWLFYVDGVESGRGAAEVRLKPGQVVQWDFHNWRDIRTSKTIVGAFPKPLDKSGVKLVCVPEGTTFCGPVRENLKEAGVQERETGTPMFVGPWEAIRDVAGVPDLEQPAAENGAYLQFQDEGRKVQIIDAVGEPSTTLTKSIGVIAAIGEGDDATWVVTGTDTSGAVQAADHLDDLPLGGRFVGVFDHNNSVEVPSYAEGTDTRQAP